jgi:hypothetical protein
VHSLGRAFVVGVALYLTCRCVLGSNRRPRPSNRTGSGAEVTGYRSFPGFRMRAPSLTIRAPLSTIPALRQRTLRTQLASICPRLSWLIATSAETMSSQEHLAQCLGCVVRCGRLHAVRTTNDPNDCTVRAHDLGRKGRRSERKFAIHSNEAGNLNRTPLSQAVVRVL